MGQDTVLSRIGETREEEKSMIILAGNKNPTQWGSSSESINQGFHSANKQIKETIQLHFCTKSLSLNLNHSILILITVL